MLTKLENELIEVDIKSEGAELTGIRLKADNTQYLWQANPKIWGRHAPVLFPVVGKLKDNKYIFDGSIYSLTQHGFARDMNFEAVKKSDSCIEYFLKSNDETMKDYPFKFELKISYEISGTSLIVGYSVINADDKDMYFSIGAHPGFNCPLRSGEDMEDYFLEFEMSERVDTYVIKEGLIAGDKLPFLNGDRIVALSKDLFKNDAIVLENLKSTWVSIKSRETGSFIKVDFEGFPYLGIWSKPEGVPFVCIEPWYGIGDFTTATGDLKVKKGIMKIMSGQAFCCSFKITVG